MKLLLVEDHADTLTAYARLLERDGHRVIAAPTCTDALEACRRHDFDLIVCDVQLPDGNGWDLLGELRAASPRTPAIALTGFGLPRDFERSREAGFVFHVVKPVSIDALRDAIRQATTAPSIEEPAAPVLRRR
jgi:CheY-like chemotaxis protein